MGRINLTASFFGGPGFTLYHAAGNHGRVPLSPHFHDEYLICAQVKGEEECHVAGKLHQFSAGDVVLINPHQVHTGNTQGDDIEYISLYVDRDVVRRFAQEVGAPTNSPEFTVVKASQHDGLVRELVNLFELLQEDDRRLLFPTPEAPEQGDVEFPGRAITGKHPAFDPSKIEAMAPREFSADRLSVDSALQRVLIHAFEEFSNLRKPVLRSTNRVGHRKVARAIEYIRDLDPSQNPASLSLDELASVAGLSKYHFLRQFNQVVGITPGAYLRTLRLCHAARMLRTTETPILDIALGVGFADHPSFSRAFARQMGMTPSEYRRLGPLS